VTGSAVRLRSFPYASALRQELGARNREYAAKYGLLHRESFGTNPAICYLPCDDNSAHGNFLSESYKNILRHENWLRRLSKVHTQARTTLPREDRRWRELDSCNSSDALLMNIFCFHGTLKNRRLFDLLGIDSCTPEFGVKARIPFANGRFDRTEIDMRLGGLLVEAKLTEFDFQSGRPELVQAYRDFGEVFERCALPREGKCYVSYQLIRNVLAAYVSRCSFCVMTDARRPDLIEAWYAVMSCIKPVDLRLRCKMVTWQELGEVSPRKLKVFLEEKYGIRPTIDL
jgi:hypothetical protein